MIDKLKKIIVDNRNSMNIYLNQDFCDIKKIKISKFYHGQDNPDNKLLFLFTYEGKIKGIIKMMRDSNYNNKLEKEYLAQKYMGKLLNNFFVPKIYFKSKIDGFFIYCEEVIRGEVLGKKTAKKYVKKVYQYQNELNKEKEIKLSKIINILESNQIKDNDYLVLLNDLIKNTEKMNKKIYIAKEHGDLTHMNIIKSQSNKFYLIDWENFGDRIFWGIDFSHYFIRANNIEESKQFVYHLKQFNQKNNFNLNLNYFLNLYFLDRIFDLLQKKYRKIYYQITSQIRSLD